MKIAIHIPMPSDGTSFYRAMPFTKLGHEYKLLTAGVRHRWSDVYDVDAIVFQRPTHHIEIANIEYFKKFRKPIVIDYDDDGFNLAESNPAYEYYRHEDKQESIRQCLRLADMVTVSTEHLKDVLLEQVPEAEITVVENAIDDDLYSFEPYEGERTKTIVMRGGGSHGPDWEPYADAIIDTLNEYPEYTLCVFGFHPDWLRKISPHQIKYYCFTDIPEYINTISELRPEIGIVPLADTKFNRSKSNIAWMEMVLAGATVYATGLPEFAKTHCSIFNNPGEFRSCFSMVIGDATTSRFSYRKSLDEIPRLSKVNEKRKDVLEYVTKTSIKYSPWKEVINEEPTDEKRFNHHLSHGEIFLNPEYNETHKKAIDSLLYKINPKTAFEIGSGTGATLVHLLKAGVMAYGAEINPYSVKYFKEHHPMYENQIIEMDVTKEPIEIDEKGELLLSIEVFEHIDMPEEWWTNFIKDLSQKFKFFYFSSTPFATTSGWDEWWSHVNLRRTTDWVKLFEANGWELLEHPSLLTKWDCLFKSKN